MAVQRDRITVFPPEGETVTVDILEDDVSIGTAHAERTTTRELTLPLAISERTSFYVPQGGGPYVVSALLDGQEVAGDGVPVTVSSFPAEIRATVNVAEMGDLSSGSSPLLLVWDSDATDYIPTESKAATVPKVFVGPTDPTTVTGAVLNGYDQWVETTF